MKNTLYLGLITAIIPLTYQGSVRAITLDFSSTSIVETGQQIEIEIAISDLGNNNAPSLGGYDFNVNFDSNILSFKSVNFGDAALGNQLELDSNGFGIISLFNQPSNDTVNLFELSGDSPTILDSLQPNSFTLATLTFDAISEGTSNLEFSDLILSDAIGDPLTVTSNTTSVIVETSTPTAVPESSTIISLLIGSLFCLGLNRRY